MDYYSFYKIDENILRRKNSTLLKVTFENWNQGCEYPKGAILKIIQKKRNHY